MLLSAWVNERLATWERWGRGRETVVRRVSGCSEGLLLYRCCVRVLVLLVLLPLGLLLRLILGLAVAVVSAEGDGVIRVRSGLGR